MWGNGRGRDKDRLNLNSYFGILKSALIGCSPNSGGVLSATSMAVIPRDQMSERAS